MRWPFGRRSHSASSPPAAAATPAPVVAPVARPAGEWRGLPVIQRTVADPPLTAPTDAFQDGLDLRQPAPLALAPLGHEMTPLAASGLVHGLATVTPPQSIGAHGPELTLRPTIQRQAAGAVDEATWPSWPADALSDRPTDAPFTVADFAGPTGPSAGTLAPTTGPSLQRAIDPALLTTALGQADGQSGDDGAAPSVQLLAAAPPSRIAPIASAARLTAAPPQARAVDISVVATATARPQLAPARSIAPEPPSTNPARPVAPIAVQRLVPPEILTRVQAPPADSQSAPGIVTLTAEPAPSDGVARAPRPDVNGDTGAVVPHPGPDRQAPQLSTPPLQRLTLGQVRRLGLGAPLARPAMTAPVAEPQPIVARAIEGSPTLPAVEHALPAPADDVGPDRAPTQIRAQPADLTVRPVQRAESMVDEPREGPVTPVTSGPVPLARLVGSFEGPLPMAPEPAAPSPSRATASPIARSSAPDMVVVPRAPLAQRVPAAPADDVDPEIPASGLTVSASAFRPFDASAPGAGPVVAREIAGPLPPRRTGPGAPVSDRAVVPSPPEPLELPRLDLQRSAAVSHASSAPWASPSSGASMWIGPTLVGPAAASPEPAPEPGIQREAETTPSQTDRVWPETDDAAQVQRVIAGSGTAVAAGEHDLDDLADRLYGRLRSQLARELLLDRERVGLIGDLR